MALTEVTGDGAVPSVLLALRDPAPLVRIEACKLLAAAKGAPSVEALIGKLHDDHELVCREAFRSLMVMDAALALRHTDSVRHMQWWPYFLESEPQHRGFLAEGPEDESRFSRDERRLYTEGFGGLVDDHGGPCFLDPEWLEADPGYRQLLRCVHLGKLAVATAAGNEAAVQHALALHSIIANDGQVGLHLRDAMAHVIAAAYSRRLYDETRLASDLLDMCVRGRRDGRLYSLAFYIGLLEAKARQFEEVSAAFPLGFGGQAADALAPVGRLRAATGIDSVFHILSHHRPPPTEDRARSGSTEAVQAAGLQDDEEEDFREESIQLPISRNLSCWCELRATPECLGFLLLGLTGRPPDTHPWENARSLGPLPVRSQLLVDLYAALGSAGAIAHNVLGRWTAGELSRSDPEVELLAGMGERAAIDLADHGQRNLFIRVA